MELRVYKIRNSKGLYSTGGVNPQFTKTGKTWPRLGPLKTHLQQFDELPQSYRDCHIVAMEYVVIEEETKDVGELHTELFNARYTRDLRHQEASLRRQLRELDGKQKRHREELESKLAKVEWELGK
jgi:hypothetical protein